MILSKGLTRLGGVVAIAALLLGLGLASAPAAHAQAPVSLWGEAPAADSVIVAWVDGGECETAAVEADASSSTGYFWAVQIDDGECEASAGSEIGFSVDGNVANETVTFSAGLAQAVTLTYDMDMGEPTGPMEPTEPTEPMEPTEPETEVMAPETGNAGFAATTSSSHALALGLGALAVAMLAGARSVTGRSR